MKLKAILCDFDGTLVDKETKYNRGIRELIFQIKSQGIQFSLATGRAYYSRVNETIIELGLNDYHIFNGGGLIYRINDARTIFMQTISSDSLKKIVSNLLKYQLNFSIETKNFAYMSSVDNYPNYAKQKYLKKLSEFTDYSSALKVLMFPKLNNIDPVKFESFKTNTLSTCKDISLMKFYYYGYHCIEMTSEKATKHTAVLEYEKLLKIPKIQIAAIGDGINDYPLFTACGYKIAMENAPEELKEIADFIAPTVENKGTVVALKHIIQKFNL